MLKQTPLIELHRQAQALLVDFAGWEMPLHYGSQIKEHNCVRQQVGMFDVSHMGIIDVSGTGANHFLRRLFANDVIKLKQDGKALYTCMLNADGGVIDDLIVYRIQPEHYRVVCNASRFNDDLAWMQQHIETQSIQLQPRPDLNIIAVQGPEAIQSLEWVLPAAQVTQIRQLSPFFAFHVKGCLYARTGYTGEDGVECIIPNSEALDLWQQLYQHGVQPCGLAARDTLRLEAGLNLYGQDMDTSTTPFESNLAWTVCWRDPKRNFIGSTALKLQQENGVTHQLVGLVLDAPGVLRNGQKVLTGAGEGKITSGGFSPTLNKAIALARIPHATKVGVPVQVERRGQLLPAIIVKLPFVRFGQAVVV